MAQRLLLATAAAATAAAAASSPPAADPGRPTLDVAALPAYFRDTDMLWGWNSSAAPGPLDPLTPLLWYSGAYLGNGVVGAMVTAVVDPATNATTGLRADVGRTDLWNCQQRMPVGYLTIAPPAGAAVARVDMRLDVFRATLTAAFTLEGGGPPATVRLSFNADGEGVSATPGLLVAVTPAAGGGDGGRVTFAWTDDTAGPCPPTSVTRGAAGGDPWGAPTNWTTQATPSGTFTVAHTQYADASVGGALTLLLGVANTQRSPLNATGSQGAAVAAVAAGVAASAAALEAASRAWWAGWWCNTSFFSFDDGSGSPAPLGPGVTRLEQFAHLAGYRYASAARGSMSDLMGPWGPAHATTCIGPWCQFTWDMNQQVMLYLPGPSNRGVELVGGPVGRMADTWVAGGAPAWAAAYGSNPPNGSPANVLWWLAQLHAYALRYGDDARLVRTVLPGLRAQLTAPPAATGLVNGSDGLLHVRGCASPEYPGMAPNATDCAYHLAIYRWAAATAGAIAGALLPSDPARPVYADIAARLAPLPVDPATGSVMVAAGVPFAIPHRHYSHLLWLYDLGGPAAAGGAGVGPATAASSLDVWWNLTCAGPQAHGPDWGGDGECRGFTQAAMSAMSAALGRPAAAVGNLTAFVRLVGLPNAMYGEEVFAGHPDEFSPVSESGYSAAASVYGLLMASAPADAGGGAPSDGVAGAAAPLVALWPAGDAFANATLFRGRAVGAVLVSAVRTRGSTAWVALEGVTLADGSGGGAAVPPVTVEVPDWGAAGVSALTVVSGTPGVTAAAVAGRPGAFNVTGLVRGGPAAALLPAGAPVPPAFVVGVAQGRNATEANAWGGRFVFRGEFV